MKTEKVSTADIDEMLDLLLDMRNSIKENQYVSNPYLLMVVNDGRMSVTAVGGKDLVASMIASYLVSSPEMLADVVNGVTEILLKKMTGGEL